MVIKEGGFPFKLYSITPDQVTVESLKDTLTILGLTCEETTLDKLQQYITDVRSQLYNGAYQAFGINHLHNSVVTISKGLWEPDGALHEMRQLDYITRNEEIFNWLKTQYKDFPGQVSAASHNKSYYSTVDAIKEAFVKVAYTTSATLISPLDKKSMESIMSGWLAGLSSDDKADFDSGQKATAIQIALNPDGDNVDAIGEAVVDWRLRIVNWAGKSKKDPGKETKIDIQSRSVNYTETSLLKKHYNAAVDKFGGV
ncbi:hypothetical protein [Photorhabdus sp. SF281]|uniref:hypothetical protein n=1 Tax=Photorhabdus sp. SF281 TaxID=3459527 RepID=UPI0040441B9A